MILFDLFRIYGKILVAIVALVIFFAFGDCLAECLVEYGGGY